MKIILLCLASGLAIQCNYAQKFDIDYYETYPELGSYALGKSIMLTGDDSIVIAGEAANNHIFIMKTDKSGDRLWNIFESTVYGADYQSINDMILDKDGNYVMVGWHNASSFTYFNKVSPQGTYLASTSDGGQFGYGPGYGVAQTLDDGFFIASVYRDYNLGDLMAVRKVNNQGVFEWSKNFLGGQPRALKKKSNTEYYMTGYRDYFKGSDIDGDVFLMKLNVNGDSVWTKIYKKDGTDEFGNDLLILPDNEGFLICGTEPDSIIGNYTQGFLIKTDINGNLEWKKTYYRGQWSTSFLKMEMDPNGDIVVMAMTNGGSSDLTLLKYNLSGDLMQVEHFDFQMNENYGDLVINKKGEIFVAGSAPNGSLLKIIDHCPLDSIKIYLLDPKPKVGDDVYVALDNSTSGFEYKLIKTNIHEVLDSVIGTGSTLYLNAGPATESANEFNQGYYVKLVHPQYDCVVFSDTLYVYIPYPVIQQVMLPAGGNASGSGGTVSYSFGQLSNKKSLGVKGTSTDGIQHPFEIMVITGLDITNIQLDVKVYPNPTNAFIILQFDPLEYDNPTYRLYDALGRGIEIKTVSDKETTIQMGNLKPSIYFLKVYDGHKELKTFKIIKN